MINQDLKGLGRKKEWGMYAFTPDTITSAMCSAHRSWDTNAQSHSKENLHNTFSGTPTSGSKWGWRMKKVNILIIIKFSCIWVDGRVDRHVAKPQNLSISWCPYYYLLRKFPIGCIRTLSSKLPDKWVLDLLKSIFPSCASFLLVASNSNLLPQNSHQSISSSFLHNK